MAFPAPASADADADVGSGGGVSLVGVVDDGLAPDTVPGLDTGIAAEGVRCDSVDGDLGDEAVLGGAVIGGQLELASISVLPELAAMHQLPEREAAYARADNTMRGYHFDWGDFTTWCTTHNTDPMPASPSALTGYLVALAEAGAEVGTLSRRPSLGIRRVHGAPPEQTAPLMPPLLLDVLAACPVTRTWPTPSSTTSGRRVRSAVRVPEPDLLRARDRALLLVGFVGALRRSELTALDVAEVAVHPNGLVLSLPRSKTHQTGEHAELVVLPRAGNPDRCPVVVLQRWMEPAGITEGPVFRGRHQGQPRRWAAPAPRISDHPGQGRPGPHRRPDHGVQRALPVGGVRHLRPLARLFTPGHRPPDPAPLDGLPGGY